jgi:hypothetical protein
LPKQCILRLRGDQKTKEINKNVLNNKGYVQTKTQMIMSSSDLQVAEQAFAALDEASKSANWSTYNIRKIQKKLYFIPIGSEGSSIMETREEQGQLTSIMIQAWPHGHRQGDRQGQGAHWSAYSTRSGSATNDKGAKYIERLPRQRLLVWNQRPESLFLSGPGQRKLAWEVRSTWGQSRQGQKGATGSWRETCLHGWGQKKANNMGWPKFDKKLLNYPCS